VIILARTFRFGGHATHDEAEARDLFSQEIFDHWAKREPIGCFEEWLRDQRQLLGRDPAAAMEQWEEQVAQEVEQAAGKALTSRRDATPDIDAMLGDVFAG
jgi:2-oxoisovalerate dehydrogenase E1 component